MCVLLGRPLLPPASAGASKLFDHTSAVQRKLILEGRQRGRIVRIFTRSDSGYNSAHNGNTALRLLADLYTPLDSKSAFRCA